MIAGVIWAGTMLKSLASSTSMLWKKLPTDVKLVLAALVAAVGLWLAHSHSVSQARAEGFKDGKASVQQAAAREVIRYRLKVDTLRIKTDKQAKKTEASVDTAEKAIADVPQEIRDSFPVVDQALRSCSVALHDCDQFRADVMTERTARDSMDQAMAVVMAAKSDTIVSLKRRPSRVEEVLVAIGVAVITFFLAR